MKIPKATRERVWSGGGALVSIAWPDDYPPPRRGEVHSLDLRSKRPPCEIVNAKELMDGTWRALVKARPATAAG